MGVLHPPAEQRLARQRQERRLVRPVLEERPLPRPGKFFQRRPRIGAEPREGGQIVGPRDDVDAVDLHHAQPVDQLEELALADLALGSGRSETLGGERDAAGLASGEGSFRQGPIIPASRLAGPVYLSNKQRTMIVNRWLISGPGSRSRRNKIGFHYRLK